ncbi:hypothetical protein Asal01_00998 [Fodinibius salicampi]
MKTLNVMNVKEEDVLNRDEMKSIMAGSGITIDGCQYPSDGCTGISSYYNCQRGNCTSWYSGSQEAIDCINLVGRQETNRIALCNKDYL